MVGEVWNAKRSSFRHKASQDCEDEQVDNAVALHLWMTTTIPEFRVKKIAYRNGYERPGEDDIHVNKEPFKRISLPEPLKPAFEVLLPSLK